MFAMSFSVCHVVLMIVMNDAVFLLFCACFQFVVTSVLSNYSYRCQPVDYSTTPLALRVISHLLVAIPQDFYYYYYEEL